MTEEKDNKQDNKKSFISDNSSRDRIFNKLNTRYITCTYHNLPRDYIVGEEINKIRNYIMNNIEAANKSIYITEIIITKEPYNYEKYPEKIAQVHLHALFVFDKKMRIHSQKTTAKLLSFEYLGIDYYPHISAMHNYKSYVNYITKLQQVDEKYKMQEYYAKVESVKLDTLRNELDSLLSQVNKAVINDLTNVLCKYSFEYQCQHMKFIKYLQSLLPNKRSRFEDFLLDTTAIRYKEMDFVNSRVYADLKEWVLPQLFNKNKSSPVIYGDSNIGKTTAINAIVSEYIANNPNLKIAFMHIKNIQELADADMYGSNNYDQIIMHFDDIDYSDGDFLDKADALKNLFEGPENKSVIRCLYGTITFNQKTHKIFSMNRDIFAKIQACIKKYEGLNCRIKPYHLLQKIALDLKSQS